MRSNESDTFTTRARRAQLVDAAIETIAELGYPRASLAQIAARAGVAKSAALYHFRNKDEIVLAVTMKVMTDAATAVVPAVAAAAPGPDRLAAYVRANVGFLVDQRAATVAMREIDTGYRSEDGRRFDQVIADGAAAEPPTGELALLDPVYLLREGIELGAFRPDLDVEFTRDTVRGALDGAVANLTRGAGYDVVAFGEELIRVLLNGIRP
ncbi:TetR/AcrR family transcriptional regulator [Tsukamurella sp. 8F]|uniref:TetR/AcrR family transcriptional regulator n=1 Tax=unclassified Tsukamurella TaxID=2633480 RepID=UPI0023B9E75D|nr:MULTISPECIES: TetR/AcrR family transcriptional regulator [unclassified Tsukamurella]MDF0532307.1 TetR/AcrR family transcriptional regulator [Tsukamurella sp. 8J]MDF0588990.1 TetR/AcrR family transcriptional regulator [Tsukamurella sp. 8F]